MFWGLHIYREPLRDASQVVWNWVKKLRFFTYCRQESATFSSHFHATWGPSFRDSLCNFFIMQKYICVQIQVDCKWRNWSRWTPCVGAMIQDCTIGRRTRVRSVQWGRDRCNRRPKGSNFDAEYCNTDNTDCQCLNDLLDGAFPFLLEAVQLFVDTNCDNDRK